MSSQKARKEPSMQYIKNTSLSIKHLNLDAHQHSEMS